MKMEKSGGRPKKETNGFEKIKTNGFQKEETKTKPNVNENVNENVNDNDNDNGNDNDNASGLYDADVEKINNSFVETLGSTNLNNIKECINYLDYMPYEVIEYALKKTARANGNWNYTMAILDSYINKNIKTLEQAKADDLKHKNKNNTQEETEEEKNARKVRELEALINGNK